MTDIYNVDIGTNCSRDKKCSLKYSSDCLNKQKYGVRLEPNLKKDLKSTICADVSLIQTGSIQKTLSIKEFQKSVKDDFKCKDGMSLCTYKRFTVCVIGKCPVTTFSYKSGEAIMSTSSDLMPIVYNYAKNPLTSSSSLMGKKNIDFGKVYSLDE